MKYRLGLDIGTNSIGWAVVGTSTNEDGKEIPSRIISSGSRIIPMDAGSLSDFDKGNSISKTSERTRQRSIRRLYERGKLRRERLHRILSLIGFLPEHYSKELDRYGKFINDNEPKIAWVKDDSSHYNFVFKDSFLEMIEDFKKNNPVIVSDSKKVPYDWTIYYLRKKALNYKISKEELSWIILSFNQKRGYFQLRGEEEEKDNTKKEEFYALKVVDIENSGDKKGNSVWYNVKLENGWVYRRASAIPLDWIGKTKDFIVTTELEKDGTEKRDKYGEIKRSFRAPKEDDWSLMMLKTESDIKFSGKTVGEYIYDALLENPEQKIKGRLVRTIERHHYRDELLKILTKQKEFHKELQDKKIYERCIEELYPNNFSHRNLISARDMVYLLVDDILFYQRPLKSKKSLIDNCPYEKNSYTNKETGEICFAPLKCIAKSHPLFQEFRLWQFLSNIRIYQKDKLVDGKLKTDVDVTSEYLKSEDDYVALFEWLNNKKNIKQDKFLSYPAFEINKNIRNNFRWNYVEDKPYPCNETHSLILEYLQKAGLEDFVFDSTFEESLWHILYSVSGKEELKKALTSFAKRNSLDNTFVDAFINIPPFEKSYGAYSAKAIKKLLPLMRMGKYWNENNIDDTTKDRIEKIINGEVDCNISEQVREKTKSLNDLNSFKGLPLWLACYIVYNRHSEASDIEKWKSPSDIDIFLKNFKQHSLRNPIVEQVVMETLRTVRDIWKEIGHIDEIHVELGREMKNNAESRKKITSKALENENTNLRIKALLMEFMNPDLGIENVRPYSQSQQEIFRIYEEGVWNSISDKDPEKEEIVAILKKFNESDVKKRPSQSEIKRYKLWLEQKYCSPYTGNIIPLGKLFTPSYEIEHIIPQSLYFDDSLSNKVICEAEVNKLKSNMLGYEFIKKHNGEKVTLNGGKTVNIFSTEEYEHFVKEHYSSNRTKMKKLLMEDIPNQFIERQLNDSRYISKYVTRLLSNIVREEGEQEYVSKNIIICNGSITDRLKKDWGVNDVWNKIIISRFKRLNEMTESHDFISVSANGHEIPTVPFHLQKGFNKKRIDHRHHAMDAIVIACADRNIVNYLNNESARSDAKISRFDLQRLLCTKKIVDEKGNYKWTINQPWETFSHDVYTSLSDIIVSFKQNLRVINKTVNHYQHYNEEGKKVMTKQVKGDSWAIRKSMHKETVFGEINLRSIETATLKSVLANPDSIVNKDLKRKIKELLTLNYKEKDIKFYFDNNSEIWSDIDLKKIKVYVFSKDTKDRFFATRKKLDESFDRKKILESITDSGIKKILLRHLEINGGNPSLAFSPDGIDMMNKNIKDLNNGKEHKPIINIRWFEKSEKFPVGLKGSKSSKFVEAAKGTNLFFAVYESEILDKKTGEIKKKRSFTSLPLNLVINRLKQGLPPAPEDENGNHPLFVLSPNDLVYVPSQEEISKGEIIKPINKERIYKMVSCTGNECLFVKHNISSCIVDKYEFSPLNKMGRSLTGEMIKDVCIPLKVNRLGKIKEML